MTRIGERNTTADRLLKASARLSYDPMVDLDWSAPLVEGKWYIPERTISLYGTPMWDRMTHGQRLELSKQELANTVSVGIWFEVILMQLLLRMAYNQDPTTSHVRYAFTEIADECRHSTMFSMLIDKVGARPYRTPRLIQRSGHALPLILRGAPMWVATLIGEEIFDAVQREHLHDDGVQPLVRGVMKIHVAEEARHVRYAREDLIRTLAEARWPTREFTRHVVAIGALLLSRLLSRPLQYTRAGLPGREAAAAARANPHRDEVLTEASAKLVRFLREADLIGGPSLALWHRAGMRI